MAAPLDAGTAGCVPNCLREAKRIRQYAITRDCAFFECHYLYGLRQREFVLGNGPASRGVAEDDQPARLSEREFGGRAKCEDWIIGRHSVRYHLTNLLRNFRTAGLQSCKHVINTVHLQGDRPEVGHVERDQRKRKRRLRGTRSRATETVALPQDVALDGLSYFVRLLACFLP